MCRHALFLQTQSHTYIYIYIYIMYAFGVCIVFDVYSHWTSSKLKVQHCNSFLGLKSRKYFVIKVLRLRSR